jgi:MSHA biogenesis protein MshN
VVAQPPAPSLPAAAQAQKEPAPPVQEAKPAELESFRLALSIDTPITERAARGAAPTEKARPKRTEQAAAPQAELPAPPQVQKRDRAYTPSERAEAAFNRALGFLNQGRVAEAESDLTSALASEPRYEPARQALVALLIEQRRIDEATPLLREGLQLDPQQAQFAMVLARIQMEQRDYVSAVETLAGVKAAAENNAEYDYLMAAALQRLSRHREAAEYYQAALDLAPQSGISWLGLAISLESLQRRQEAAEAYRRALASNTLSGDVRLYAEQRAKQLR